MKFPCASLLSAAVAAACAATVQKDFSLPLPPGAAPLIEVVDPTEWPDLSEAWYRPDEVGQALQGSLAWMDTDHARQFFPVAGITHARALSSLIVFGELLDNAASPEEFSRALRERFTLYKSAGWDGRGGGVLFTAYCTPVLSGSLAPSERFAYPLYGLPEDLAKGEGGSILGRRAPDGGTSPYPTRREIETEGLMEGRDLELVWLADPLDAFIAHVNGSAFVRLPDGSMARFGYAANNGRDYTSLSRSLVEAGRLESDDSNLTALRRWARQSPDEVASFLQRNDRYVFFVPIDGTPRGSLNVPVTPERTLATDKSLFPRGSLVFVETHLSGARLNEGKEFHQFMFDQDTGGAIRTAGRADIYLGVGGAAEELAGSTRVEGQLYYLFLKP
ncbi:MAG: MltA domain-containing protein [Planctomycetota bacterium]|jgi:membrane-bound lytic murein transglycosylase A|nr:MltA domain-containing protein [Planctomycetota bacterium]MDP6762748.1 MltA domain-containing protein [Planctomycetota bacterium]MDP6988526.1 MltA domain-containing protein [Planctomycetota bacterium]